MMISAQKIRLSGSAFNTWGCLVSVILVVALAAGCAQTPKGALSTGKGDDGMDRQESIRFSINAPDADNVVLFLMSTHDPVPMTWEILAAEGEDGTWTADFDLVPGEYRYFFSVDGAFTVGQGRGRVERDDFGGKTRVLTIFQGPDGALSAF